MYTWANNMLTTLSAGITASATSMSVASVGDLTLGTNETAFLTLQNDDASLYEIVKVTAISGLTLTIERAQEGTTAQAWDAGAIVVGGVPTKSQLKNFELKNEKFRNVTSGAITRTNGGNQNYTLTANENITFDLQDGDNLLLRLSTSTFTPTIVGVAGWFGGSPTFENNKTYLLTVWRIGAELEGSWDVRS